jgi:hypothetical protein
VAANLLIGISVCFNLLAEEQQGVGQLIGRVMFVLCLRHLFGELYNVCSFYDGVPHVLAELLVTGVHFIGSE